MSGRGRSVRRWVFWRLYSAVEVLDGAVGWLHRQVARIEPPFIPRPLPEPHYTNHTEQCPDCGGYLAIPLASNWSEATRNRWITSAKDVHTMRCAAANDRSVRPVTGGSSVESPAHVSGSTPSPTSEETKK